jgi:putative ABC transport system permease protein
MLPFRFAGVTGQLAWANLADGRRRSASVAAPVIVLVALVLGQATASGSFTASGVAEQRRGTAADLVVESSGPVPSIRSSATVEVSSETELPITITTGRGEDEETEIGSALVIDPRRYTAAHPGTADLSALTGAVAAAGPGGMTSIGDTVRVRLADGDLGALRVVAAVPEAMSGGPDLLLPAGLVPAERLRDAPTRTFVTVAGDPAPVAAALAGSGTVRTVDDYLAADAAARGSISNKILLVVLGLGALYALIGVVNSVVIAAAARRREFAEARATGMTRGHVIRAALLESAAVTSAGLVLGALAAGLAFIAVLSSTKAVTGTATLDLPWPVAGGLIATAFTVTSVTSVITSWSATRQRPVVLLGARE